MGYNPIVILPIEPLYYMTRVRKFARVTLWLSLSLAIMLAIIGGVAYIYLESHLPDVDTLNNVQLQVPLRIYSADNKLIAEYGEKRRIPIALAQIPKPLIQALLATEDQRYYEHPGVDVFGLVRAAIRVIATGEKVQGGSTITMQVARNFFLDRKKTYIRKINEILLAIKIDRELSKDRILELYLNKIYFGNRAYGVGAAAQVYYGKTPMELSLPQQAMLSGLPKAPSSLNPLANPTAAKKRRDHVLKRMFEENFIDEGTYIQAINTPLSASYHRPDIQVTAHYVAEMIRLALKNKYGDEIYTNGFRVYTTINSALQNAGRQAVEQAVEAYDHRHGYRGPEKNIGDPSQLNVDEVLEQLSALPEYNGLVAAVVLQTDGYTINALTADGKNISIQRDGLIWARKSLDYKYVGAVPKQASDIVKPGDIIRVKAAEDGSYALSQLPEVEGALVAINPKNGAVLSLMGGYSFSHSKFNRVTQMQRQPGSSFKPFVYAAALAKGFTLATIINDAPIVRADPSLQNLWRPQNDTRRFYGPTRLRIGLIRSRNLVSIRLLENIGIDYAIDFLSRFGFEKEELPKSLSLALGSLDVTPLKLAEAYAVFANGGFKVQPYIIDRITDYNNQTIFEEKPLTACNSCDQDDVIESGLPLQQQAKRVLSPQVTYLMNSVLRDVIQSGTGRAAKVLNRRDIAGKTGTTNDQVDAWFAGYNGDIVTITWLGFDNPSSLYEYASKAALPMWIDFMRTALMGTPETITNEPPNLVTVRIDPKTGLLANAQQKDSVFETFRVKNVPKEYSVQSIWQPSKTGQTIDEDEDDEHLY